MICELCKQKLNIKWYDQKPMICPLCHSEIKQDMEWDSEKNMPMHRSSCNCKGTGWHYNCYDKEKIINLINAELADKYLVLMEIQKNPIDTNNSTEFECKCGRGGQIAEGEESEPCPDCGRKYVGVYNKKKYNIETKELL